MTAEDYGLARRMRHQLEPVHAAFWYAPEVFEEAARLGYDVQTRWRGDGHIAALQVAGLDPCEALVSFAAIGAAPAEVFASRGWSAAEWSAARDRLAARGWVDAEGVATERGRKGRDEIEWRTDRLADAPWRALGADHAQRLAELTGPLLGAAFESGLLPLQSTLGIAAVPAPVPHP
jgi:hypothetical protein